MTTPARVILRLAGEENVMNKQLRHFAFTWNNYSKHDKDYESSLFAQLSKLGANYFIYAHEVGEEGTPHLQGYVQLKERRYFQTIKKTLHSSVHITIIMGSSQDNINYCKKVDKNPIEFGEHRDIGRARAKQARDWELLLNLAKDNKLLQIAQDSPRDYIIYHNVLHKIATEHMKPIAKERHCLWLYGLPGIGKSRAIQQLFPDAYWRLPNKWWDGYQDEDVAVFDDLDNAKIYSHLKRWADRYKVIGEIKGAAVPLNYSYFIATSNADPFAVGALDDSVSSTTSRAVARRFLVCKGLSWSDVLGDLIVQRYQLHPEINLLEPDRLPIPLKLALIEDGWANLPNDLLGEY